MNLKYEVIEPGTGNFDEFYAYLKDIDHTYKPTLSSRVNLKEWTRKLIDHATLFVYRDNGAIVACAAEYVNKAPEYSFGTLLASNTDYSDYMLGPDLVMRSLKYEKEYGSAGKIGKIRSSNKPLVSFYTKLGFEIVGRSNYPNSTVEELEIKKTF